MVVGDKNNSDLSDVDTGLGNTPSDAVTGINNVMRAVNG
jgi:hypothetical protein